VLAWFGHVIELGQSSVGRDAASGVPAGLPTGGLPGDSKGGSAGGLPPGAGVANLPIAKTITTSDTSTSVVIDGSGPAITCGKTPVTTYSDVLYDTPTSGGKPVPLKLDVQVPKGAGKKPLVVFITGGGFVLAHKSANLNQRTYIAEQGYVVASIDYRTASNGATYKDTISDVKSAIRYLRAHSDQYGIDPSKVAMWGQSAGGYLAAMTGGTNALEQFEGDGNLGQSSVVQAVVDEFGPSDLSKIASDYDQATQKAKYLAGNSLAQFVFGAGTKLSIQDDPTASAAASPLTYVISSNPPFVLLHGSADALLSPSQTLILHDALCAKGAESTRYVVKGANHGELPFLGCDATLLKQWSSQQVMGVIVRFLHKHLG
jgi:acetyl esterase/lipase